MITFKNKIILINNRRTSMRLYSEEWRALDYICKKENVRRNILIGNLDAIKTKNIGLTSLTRLFLLSYYQNMANHSPNAHKSTNLLSDIMEKFKVSDIRVTK